MLQPSNEKHAYLRAIRSTFHTLSDLEQHLTSTFITSTIRRHLHKKALNLLTILDTKVSVYHDYTTQSQWDYITCVYNTPTNEYKEICDNINDLKRLYDICRSINIQTYLQYFDANILMLKTNHIQFLLFEYEPKEILQYLFNKLNCNKNKAGYYLIYIFAYVIRKRMESGVVFNVINSLIKCFGEERNESLKVVYLQGFVYFCCFKSEYYGKLKFVFEGGTRLMGKVNENIMGVFCEMFGGVVVSEGCDEESWQLLKWFPLDPAPVKNIMDLYSDQYLTFNKSI